MLDSRFRSARDGALGIVWAQPRSKYEDWLAGLVGGVGGDLYEMEKLGGGRADVKVASWNEQLAACRLRLRLRAKAVRTKVVDAVDLDFLIVAIFRQRHIVQQGTQDKWAGHCLLVAGVLG